MPIENVKDVTALLQVFDMRKSVAFYTDVLGFEITARHEPDGHLYWVRMKLGGARLMLNAKYEDDQRPQQPDAPTGHDDVGLYFHCDDVDAAYAAIRDKWPHVKPPKDAYYGMRQMYLKDPDGFVLCFQHPVNQK